MNLIVRNDIMTWMNLSRTGYQMDTYSTSIGFDLVKMRVRVERVDWDYVSELCGRSDGYTDMYSKDPAQHIRYTAAIGSHLPLQIAGNRLSLYADGEDYDFMYSSIIVEYRFWKLRLIAGKARSSGARSEDTMQLSVNVSPRNEILGNLDNMNVNLLQERVRGIFEKLSSDFGIFLDPAEARLNYIEFNRNLPMEDMDRPFDVPYSHPEKNLIETDVLSYCKTAFKNLPMLPAKFEVRPSEASLGLNGLVEWRGIFADGSTIALHVYQKNLEMEKQRENKNDRLLVATAITRIEFVARKGKMVRSWVKTDDLFTLDQEALEKAYFKYLRKYVVRLYEGQFERLVNAMSQERVDTSKKNWTDSYAHTLLWFSEKFGVDMRFVKIDDIREMLIENESKSNTIAQNLSRCVRTIAKKCEDKPSHIDVARNVEKALMSAPAEYDVKYFVYDKQILKRIKKELLDPHI